MLGYAGDPAVGLLGNDGRQEFSGTVTVDGVPLSRGSVSFRPVDGGQSGSSGAIVEDGQFFVPAAKGLVPGKYTVTVQAYKETGRIIKDPQVGDRPESVPVHFKAEGLLDAAIGADGSNRFAFHLTSQK